MEWDEENTKLKELLKEGLTSGQIARKLGRSRSAVIGRIHRQGLALKNNKASKIAIQAQKAAVRYDRHTRENNKALVERIKKKAIKSPWASSVPYFPKEAIDPEALIRDDLDQPSPVFSKSLMDVPYNTCRWPYTLPSGEVLYCGRALSRKSYCAFHSKKVYTRRVTCNA